MAEPPVACSLTAAQRALRDDLLPGLLAHAEETCRLAHGRRWRFTPARGLLQRIGATIEAERHCCRFLTFRVECEPAGGPVWLEATGPDGTGAFLDTLQQA